MIGANLYAADYEGAPPGPPTGPQWGNGASGLYIAMRDYGGIAQNSNIWFRLLGD